MQYYFLKYKIKSSMDPPKFAFVNNNTLFVVSDRSKYTNETVI